MRTTVEITAEQRARLLEMAARRGEKGFSKLVQEALDAFLASQDDKERRIERAARLRGSLNSAEAEALRERARELREDWR